MQETHFVCEADYRVLKDDFVIYTAFSSHFGAGVSLLVGRSLDAIVNVAYAGDGGRLLVADVAVKTFEFRIAAVHVPVVRNRLKRVPNEAVKCNAFCVRKS